MSSKSRKKLSQTQKEAILFDSDFSCCICRNRNKPIQIHHIDENPANNQMDNLAVLCLEDHDKATIKGGLGCQMTPGLVKKFRDEWLEIVSSRRNKHLHSQLSEIDLHQSFLEALACHEIIKLEHKILQCDLNSEVPPLYDLWAYTFYQYGIPTKARIMDLLYTLATHVNAGMSAKVAKTIEGLAMNSLPIFSLVAPERKTPSQGQIDVLISANCVGSTMAYHATKRLQDIKVVAAGAQIMSSVLRYAKLNALDKLYKQVNKDFEDIIKMAVQINFTDAKEWLRFMQADALALDGDELPIVPRDVQMKI